MNQWDSSKMILIKRILQLVLPIATFPMAKGKAVKANESLAIF